MDIRPRETVILAANFDSMVSWYRDILGFKITKTFQDEFHYCNLETQSGIQIGIADAKEMGVGRVEGAGNSVVLQIEVDDVREFCRYLQGHGTSFTGGPSFDKKDHFWFGSFSDPEGNPIWVVDENCP